MTCLPCARLFFVTMYCFIAVSDFRLSVDNQEPLMFYLYLLFPAVAVTVFLLAVCMARLRTFWSSTFRSSLPACLWSIISFSMLFFVNLDVYFHFLEQIHIFPIFQFFMFNLLGSFDSSSMEPLAFDFRTLSWLSPCMALSSTLSEFIDITFVVIVVDLS